MPLCSRRAWTTCQGPVDPSRLTTYPPPVATTTASSFHVFNQISRPEDGGVIIITTIHTQRPTSSYVYQFYPGKPRAIVPLLSRHSQGLLAAFEGSQYRGLVHLAIYTGMRRSELLGLRWRDVDLDKATLRIVQSLQRTNDGVFRIEKPKTARSRRSIALSSAAVESLRAH